MANSASALCKPPSSVNSTVASVAAPFAATKADLRSKSGSMGLKSNKTESLLLCPPQLPTENQEPNGQGVATKATRNPTKLMLIPGSIMNREVLRANLAS